MIAATRQDVDHTVLNRLLLTLSDDELAHLSQLAQRHALYAVLVQTLQSPKITAIETGRKRDLKAKAFHLLQYNIAMSAELLRIMALFDTHKIRALAFKGPVLSQFAYGDISLRQYGDLDILIEKESLTKVITLMREHGYDLEIELSKESLDTFYSCVNVIGLHKGPIRIEIHWELLSANYAIDWKSTTLWKQHGSVSINHRSIPTLAFDDHLIYLAIHGSKHMFERLEWISDIDRVIRSQHDINWRRLSAKAEALGVKRMLLLSLALAQRFFQLELPLSVHQEIDKDPMIILLVRKVIRLHYTDQDKSDTWRTFFILWQMRERASDRLSFLYKALFSPKFDDFKFIQLPKRLAFLYPIIRPYRLVMKNFRA